MTSEKNTSPATLATAKHGGCVQLKDGQHVLVLREMRAQFTDAGSPARTAALDAAIAALSAQPSPGGQDAARYERLFLSAVEMLTKISLRLGLEPNSDGVEPMLAAIDALAARQPVEVSEGGFRAAASRQTASAESYATAEALIAAARQPVGEPVRPTVPAEVICAIGGLATVAQKESPDLAAKYIGVVDAWLYATPPVQPPAQAVDLPYSLDADPAGIRARVADVITGTLMVGAQGHTPPPAGHWAEPFWQAARADATAKAVDLPAFKALYRAYVRMLESGRDRIIDLGGTCDPVDVMEANDVDLQAARHVLDSQAVGNG